MAGIQLALMRSSYWRQWRNGLAGYSAKMTQLAAGIAKST